MPNLRDLKRKRAGFLGRVGLREPQTVLESKEKRLVRRGVPIVLDAWGLAERAFLGVFTRCLHVPIALGTWGSAGWHPVRDGVPIVQDAWN